MTANLEKRQRLMQINARPSQLEHSEQTTKMSPAAAAIEALASQTTDAAHERNATAAQAVSVQQSVAPTQTGGAGPSLAMTAQAQGYASPMAQMQQQQSPQAAQTVAQMQQQQGQMSMAQRVPRFSPMCAGAGHLPMPPCGGNGNGTATSGRNVTLKRMQQGIQARQDFCDFEFCPVM
jgi:hypothetical protein